MNLATCYEVLGLSPGATADEVHSVYKRLALKYHPDRSRGDPRSHSAFCQVTAAYATLKEAFAAMEGSKNMGQCQRCEQIRELYFGQDGSRGCAECLLALRGRRLPMILETVRCVLAIGLQLAAVYCLVISILEESVGAAFAGMACLVGALLALTYNVLTSVVVKG